MTVQLPIVSNYNYYLLFIKSIPVLFTFHKPQYTSTCILDKKVMENGYLEGAPKFTCKENETISQQIVSWVFGLSDYVCGIQGVDKKN